MIHVILTSGLVHFAVMKKAAGFPGVQWRVNEG